MKKIFSLVLATVMLLCATGLNAFALTPEESKNAVDTAFNAMFATVAGDVNGDGTFSAADARVTLLASAGLLTDVADASAADMDGDGKITAIDARALLRISAKLDSESFLYSATDKLNLFNALANDLKASSERFQYASATTNIDMTYDNRKLVDKFNKQMNAITGVDEKIDLAAELMKDKGKVKNRCYTGLKAATTTTYPVTGQNFVSMLTLKDISSVEYKTNQSIKFTPVNAANVLQDRHVIEMTGLDSITVYFANENVSTLPEDSTTLKHGKIFDVPTKDDLTSGYNQINNLFKGMEDTIGTMTAKFNNINYHDSFVTIYFDHATKKVCATEYNLNYDFTVNLAMDLYFPLVINLDGNMNITDKENVKYVYCFKNNYESLGR